MEALEWLQGAACLTVIDRKLQLQQKGFGAPAPLHSLITNLLITCWLEAYCAGTGVQTRAVRTHGRLCSGAATAPQPKHAG